MAFKKQIHYYISNSEDDNMFGDIIVTNGVMDAKEKSGGNWVKITKEKFESRTNDKIDNESKTGWTCVEDYNYVSNEVAYYENLHDDDHMISFRFF